MRKGLQGAQEGIPVVVLKHDGSYVGSYPNCQDAGTKLNIQGNNIAKCLAGIIHQTEGYIFIKTENYNPAVKTTLASIKRKRKFLKGK